MPGNSHQCLLCLRCEPQHASERPPDCGATPTARSVARIQRVGWPKIRVSDYEIVVPSRRAATRTARGQAHRARSAPQTACPADRTGREPPRHAPHTRQGTPCRASDAVPPLFDCRLVCLAQPATRLSAGFTACDLVAPHRVMDQPLSNRAQFVLSGSRIKYPGVHSCVRYGLHSACYWPPQPTPV